MSEQGTVVKFLADRNFGFIKVGSGDESKDWFFHADAIESDDDFNALREGSDVVFVPGEHKGKPVATQVRIIQ